MIQGEFKFVSYKKKFTRNSQIPLSNMSELVCPGNTVSGIKCRSRLAKSLSVPQTLKYELTSRQVLNHVNVELCSEIFRILLCLHYQGI